MSGLDNLFHGELKRIKPSKIVKPLSTDNVSDFFLTLGVIYNDLKSLFFHVIQTQKKFEHVQPNEVSIEAGEYGGILQHLNRIIVSTLHEFFEFIEKNEQILETSQFKLIYDKLDDEFKERWGILISVAKKDPQKNAMGKILMLVRDNVGFHYSRKEIRKGFVDHFFNDSKDDSNMHACYYMGENMANTRFFFSDAAAKRVTKTEIDTRVKHLEFEEYEERFKDILENVNSTLFNLMKQYIKQLPPN